MGLGGAVRGMGRIRVRVAHIKLRIWWARGRGGGGVDGSTSHAQCFPPRRRRRSGRPPRRAHHAVRTAPAIAQLAATAAPNVASGRRGGGEPRTPAATPRTAASSRSTCARARRRLRRVALAPMRRMPVAPPPEDLWANRVGGEGVTYSSRTSRRGGGGSVGKRATHPMARGWRCEGTQSDVLWAATGGARGGARAAGGRGVGAG